MKSNDVARARLDAIISDIAQTQQALLRAGLTPVDIYDPADREAYDIICRIERRLKQQAEAAE